MSDLGRQDLPLIRARSFLFVPGHRPERFAKAAGSGADQVVLDLEDAVGLADKVEARGHVLCYLAQGGEAIVRINAHDSAYFADDIKALAGLPHVVVCLPKAEPEALSALHYLAPKLPVIALIETVAGVLRLEQIARFGSVKRLAFGHLDFAADAALPDHGLALDLTRYQIMMQSRDAGLPAPIDGVTTSLMDEARIAADTAHAREMGFGAKLCIHPAQVAMVNQGFTPTAAERDWARRVISALEEAGGAAVQVDGKMVDLPMRKRAASLLAAFQ